MNLQYLTLDTRKTNENEKKMKRFNIVNANTKFRNPFLTVLILFFYQLSLGKLILFLLKNWILFSATHFRKSHVFDPHFWRPSHNMKLGHNSHLTFIPNNVQTKRRGTANGYKRERWVLLKHQISPWRHLWRLNKLWLKSAIVGQFVSLG